MTAKQRISLIDLLTTKLENRTDRLVNGCTTKILDYLRDNLKKENGKVLNTPMNINIANQINRLLKECNKEAKKYTNSLAKDYDKINDSSGKYFKNIANVVPINKEVEKKYGFKNPDKSFLATEFTFNKIIGLTIAAITGNFVLKELKKVIQKEIIVQLPKNVNDVLVNIDRDLQKANGKELGLLWYNYQGGLIEDSRPFCIIRNNQYFHESEIEKFGTSQDKFGGYTNKSLGEFQGKTSPYDPFKDLGGYNCRHYLSAISNAKAIRLKLMDKDGNILRQAA